MGEILLECGDPPDIRATLLKNNARAPHLESKGAPSRALSYEETRMFKSLSIAAAVLVAFTLLVTATQGLALP
ncbi:hypothetical protein R3X27_22665 [Tropicimonas sp. TH_r6]|uniref:hypothetical protein n=1 Tax=Tropicimonas sp. TH_r6 TaxID=3082085 RepID=UPI002955A595|nr:hypothetical protein [Tropicimonas sp. TH_r6]MDV7145498.1 hypothetical protein [Tropicimonas sp. TH_r6]